MRKMMNAPAGGAYIARFWMCANDSEGTIPMAEVGGDA